MNRISKKSILVVDDDEDLLVMLEEVLLYSHFNVKGVKQTQNIFGVIENYKPDLVVMDCILNGINGSELCHQIKTDSRMEKLPVILISAYPRVLESLGRYGCDVFIAKPFNITDLISAIDDCLQATA